MLINKKELTEKIFNSLTTDWIATTTIACKLKIHPYRVQAILIELLDQGYIEQKLTSHYTYWRKYKNETIENEQGHKESCYAR
jgi:Mn-dependent DtxR family transcriptional regulator